MPFLCEDLSRYGVVLIPPSTAEYFQLLADIEQRLQNRPQGSPPVSDKTISRISEHDTSGSAILLNRADVAIASIAYVWSFSGRDGQTFPHSFVPGTNPSVLLPFGLDERSRRFDAFWHTIFPGSKRLMVSDGSIFGDNTDVRPPIADELLRGGFVSMRGGSGADHLEPSKLTLDGVFFVDGGFAGPNQLGSWEQGVFAAEAHLACGALARKTRSGGAPPAEFFAQVQALTGQADSDELPVPPPPPSLKPAPPDPEPIRKFEQRTAGHQVFGMRKRLGDEATIARIEAWADAPVPKFHKL
jgi:hypothetical protein